MRNWGARMQDIIVANNEKGHSASLVLPLAQLPLASHNDSGMLHLQLNWLCVPNALICAGR